MRVVDTAFLEDLWGRWDEDDAPVLAGRLLTAEQRHLPGVGEGAPRLSGHRRQIWIDYGRLRRDENCCSEEVPGELIVSHLKVGIAFEYTTQV